MRGVASVALLALLVLDLSLAWAGLRSPIVDAISVPGGAFVAAITFIYVCISMVESRYAIKSKLIVVAGFFAAVFIGWRIFYGEGLLLSRRISEEILNRAISGSVSIESSEKLSSSDVDRIKRSAPSEWRLAFCNPLWKQFDYVGILDGGPAIGIRITMPHGFAQGGSAWAYRETTFDARYTASGKPLPIGRCE
jgi:hypothetical protein